MILYLCIYVCIKEFLVAKERMYRGRLILETGGHSNIHSTSIYCMCAVCQALFWMPVDMPL
jgi:hypothetical protein